jgi:hypothetical protein
MGFWRWFARDRAKWVPPLRCPICHREVVGYTGGRVRGDNQWSARKPTIRQDLIDHCPVHGKTHFHHPKPD